MAETSPSTDTTENDLIGFEESSINFQPDLLTPVSSNTNVNSLQMDDHSNRSHSQYSYGNHSSPFFADATLDLDEAHDIAETPEAAPRSLVAVAATTNRLSLAHDAALHGVDFPAGLLLNNNHLQVPSLTLLGEEGEEIDETVNMNYSDSSSSNSPPQKTQFARITSLETEGNHLSINISNATAAMAIRLKARPKTIPKKPRDIAWAVAFFCIVPIGLLGPFKFVASPPQSPLAQHPLSTASLHALVWSAVAAFLLSRVLYLTRDGEGTAPVGITSIISGNVTPAASLVILLQLLDYKTRFDLNYMVNTLTRLAPVAAVATTCIAAGFLWWALPQPLARFVTCVASLAYILRQDNTPALEWMQSQRRRNHAAGSANLGYANANSLPSMHDSNYVTTLSSRHAFFQALLCMALEVLSRSLRRRSFYRALVALLAVQWMLLWLWRSALLRVLASESTSQLAATVLVLLAGKWATGTVARMLSHLASGGVLCWFMEQARQLPQPAMEQENAKDSANALESAANGSTETGANAGHNRKDSNIPEAYRSVDASVYQSVLEIDDALEDDFEVDEAELETSHFDHRLDPFHRTRQQPASAQQTLSTVKGFIMAGLTVSFGSVVQCGLLGGLAQFVWSQVRKIDVARSIMVQTGQAGFQGMHVGRRNATILSRVGGALSNASRGFISRFSDLPMCHVAAYYKSYHSAARDVALIIEESGVEQIIHSDISTHMCACVGGSLAGIIVVLSHFIMVHQLKSKAEVTSLHIAENFFLSFVLSYTLLFTVMEPIRAAVKSIYISFAQHPQSLCQTYPLVYHRLNRLSENDSLS